MDDVQKIKSVTKKKKALLVVTIIFVSIEMILFLAEDDFVIYLGIRAYTQLRKSIGIIDIILFFFLILMFVKAARIENALKVRQAKAAVLKETPDPALKAGKKLDPAKIKRLLKEKQSKWEDYLLNYNRAEWEKVRALLATVFDNMNEMDRCQERLRDLLDQNGAEALRDTEEILENTEQYICRNIRKLLNTMTASDVKSRNDINTVITAASECTKSNRTVLENTRGFIVAITEYLNLQDDDEDSMAEMNIYKQAILSQIDGGESQEE